MKEVIVLLLITMVAWNGACSENSYLHPVKDDQTDVMKEKTYSLSNDSVNAVVKVIQYSKAIINYEITIVTSKNRIEQKGYALNLSSEMNGGVEYEMDEKGNELCVIAYNSYYCGCSDHIDLEFRIASDNNKLNIISSGKFRNDLFKDSFVKEENLQTKVSLLGYLYLKE